ncbi:TetR/AcrR family transcriptional regulator [Streptomyces sp. Je 1-369]|uniref:TetR/AcrR family transcriptional regulator n=1 Tax=Streptomyces sp. Je 1-369 TaxID=2966192 RepID=UPI002285F444|nr:TetR/AcrR family transcriptional regulator [Streptomyces sp. Je 1-369]WAL99649.1 TetR/AcrR family transcriptional regulator [Streptomyces sp. Je 1-369]
MTTSSSTPNPTSRARTPRERYREQTRAEIKQIAVGQLATGGVEGVALLRIAKEIGMSGPALYRYFASRDDLLTELVVDAYQSVAADIQAVDISDVGTSVGDNSPGGRTALHALATAFRDWAVAQPHLYLLIQGTPVPGFRPPDETVAHARAVLGPFLPVFAEGRPSSSVEPLVAEFSRWLRDDTAVAAWVEQWTGLPPDEPAAAVALTGALTAWPQLHGTVGLEAAGQFAGMGHRPATLLAAQVDMLADAFQLP